MRVAAVKFGNSIGTLGEAAGKLSKLTGTPQDDGVVCFGSVVVDAAAVA
jgi:hypothetical protein